MNNNNTASSNTKKAVSKKKKKVGIPKKGAAVAGGVTGGKKKNKVSKEKKGKETAEGSEQLFLKSTDDGSIDRNDDSEGDYSDVEDEGTEGYRAGGYHKVNIGDKFNSRYTVVQKLGWGHFSTVWMTYDKCAKREAHRMVALKIQKSATQYREAAYDEIELLNCVSAAVVSASIKGDIVEPFDPCVVQLLDHFEHNGQNGRHVCMAFEVLGENLLSVIKKYNHKGIPIRIVKNIARQMVFGLDFLHRCVRMSVLNLLLSFVLFAAYDLLRLLKGLFFLSSLVALSRPPLTGSVRSYTLT